jgi:uridylate kinase
MGMLATVINALALREVFEELGTKSVVVSNLYLPQILNNMNHKQVISLLENREIVVFGGGTGQPYFTTDTGAALWALKVKADVILKATKVDGVYSSDPMSNPNAKRYNEISLTEAFQKGLKVMDNTAFSLCMKHQLPIVVYKLLPGNTKRAIYKRDIGTLVY